MDSRDLLPPEIWLLVFGKVEDPQDWLNLSRTSIYLQELVGEKRTTALFSQVLPCVMDYLGGRNLGQVLELRLVVRSWKAAVDKILEKSASEDDVLHHRRRQLEECYNLRDSARIFSFLVKFASHSGNPFVGRFVSFKYDHNLSSEDIEEYCLLATQLLTKFGAQLRAMHVGILRTSFANCVTRLLAVLQHLPNLDSLSVHCFGCSNSPLHNGGEVIGLIPYIEMEPLPHLLNLKSIWFTGVSESGVLLNLQNTVARLCCNPNSLKSVQTLGFPSELQAFPNLESAVVLLHQAEDCSNLPSPPWSSLSKLTVSHYFEHHLRSVYNCINQFKATLTSLHLMSDLPPDRHFKLKLDLPQLKQLTIQKYGSISLGILTNLTALEVLSIHHDRNPFVFGVGGEQLELKRYIECVEAGLARWGLWTNLPKLTRIWLIGGDERRRRQQQDGQRAFRSLYHVATRSVQKFQRKSNQRC